MTDPDLKEHVIQTLKMVPENRRQALSDGSIHGIVNNEGREASKLDVKQACAELADEGRLRVIAEKGTSKRYELTDDVRRQNR